MADEPVIAVEVVYALPTVQRLIRLEVPSGTTIRAALRLSALDEEFPELDVAHCPLGIFGREEPDSYVLQAGDRVEVYRPLVNEPRETRRQLAARGQTMGTPKK